MAARATHRAAVTSVTSTPRPDSSRRRASASRATSTSSNGSIRSPITWYFSWPLPAISTRSPGCAIANRALDRRRAIDDRQARSVARRRRRSAGIAMPRLISSMMRSGSSRARVVGGDHDDVAQACRDHAHQRALGPIAIAAAAEHRDEPAAAPAGAPSRAGSSARRRCARSRRRRARRRRRSTRPGSGRARPRAPRRPASIAVERHVRAPSRSRPRRGCCRRSAGRPAATGRAPGRAASRPRTPARRARTTAGRARRRPAASIA